MANIQQTNSDLPSRKRGTRRTPPIAPITDTKDQQVTGAQHAGQSAGAVHNTAALVDEFLRQMDQVSTAGAETMLAAYQQNPYQTLEKFAEGVRGMSQDAEFFRAIVREGFDGAPTAIRALANHYAAPETEA